MYQFHFEPSIPELFYAEAFFINVSAAAIWTLFLALRSLVP